MKVQYPIHGSLQMTFRIPSLMSTHSSPTMSAAGTLRKLKPPAVFCRPARQAVMFVGQNPRSTRAN